MSQQGGQNLTVRTVKDVSSNTDILVNNNPEIFNISPRPGGFLKVMVPTKSQDYIAMDDSPTCDVLTSSLGVTFKDKSTSRPSQTRKSISSLASSLSRTPRSTGISMIIPETPSREFRLARAIDESDWDITAVDETHTVVGISNPLQDSINMLAVTISTIMLLAAKLNVPEEYLIWAEEYLSCFKDDHGNYPPNIDGILFEIGMKRCECEGRNSSQSHSKDKDKPEKKKSSASKSDSPKSESPKSGSSKYSSPKSPKSGKSSGSRSPTLQNASSKESLTSTLVTEKPEVKKKPSSKSGSRAGSKPNSKSKLPDTV